MTVHLLQFCSTAIYNELHDRTSYQGATASRAVHSSRSARPTSSQLFSNANARLCRCCPGNVPPRAYRVSCCSALIISAECCVLRMRCWSPEIRVAMGKGRKGRSAKSRLRQPGASSSYNEIDLQDFLQSSESLPASTSHIAMVCVPSQRP